MAKPAAAIRAAVQAAYPGATVIGRGRHWIKHQAPSGRVILEHAIGPLHRVDGQTEIDSDWQPTTGAWQWEMVTADYHAHARNVFNAGDLLEYRDPVTQEWVIFDPQSLNWTNQDNSRQQIAIKQAVNASVSGDVMTFPAAYGTGRHFRYELQTSRLKKLITIDALANLPTPTVTGTVWLEAEFTLSTSAGVAFYLDGVKWAKTNNIRVRTANRIECRDEATGNTLLWVLDFPRAFDSGGSEIFGEMEVRRQGGATNLFITVRVPKTWIDTAVFPIHLDPTIDQSVAASADDAGQAASGEVNFIQSTLGLVDAANEWGAMRWPGVTIPDGATIDVAYVSVSVNHAAADEPQHLFFFQNADAPAQFTATTNNISSRTYITETVLWDVSDLGATTGVETYFNTPSMVMIIEMLMAARSYASGRAMVCAFRGFGADATRDLEVTSYDGNSSFAAKLHIEYTEGGGATGNRRRRFFAGAH